MTAIGHVPVGTRIGVLPLLAGAVVTAALVAVGPAAAVAGWWSLAALGLAGVVSVLTAVSHADLLAQSPTGDRHAHVRERLGPVPARLSGLLSVVGRVVAAAAVTGAAGTYLWPARPAYAAVALLVAVTALVVAPPAVPPAVTRAAWAVVLLTVVGFVVVGLAIAPADAAVPAAPGTPGTDDPTGVLSAAGLLTLGFLGLERTGTARTAVPVVLASLLVSLGVAVVVLRQLGGPRVALSPTPLRDALVAADGAGLDPLLTLGLALGAVLAVRALLDGALGAARDLAAHGELPGEARHHALAVAVLAVGAAVAVAPALLAEVAACLLLGHAAFVNSSARSLPRHDRSSWVRTGCCGLVLSVVIGVNISIPALATAAGVLLLGGGALWAHRTRAVT
ncbi:hypothetical protein L6E12_13735 [Actinokineospora sp. PR83]|uniref:hypothetical protein n=1 Tax=Actinokineospora sp. PR83 TaxID=2884908 RepID=UPI001F190433|nr:hypothetical protein [Actinokineospora sp. PR83]MCG8916853.1 hypothetical protein [Actinokineospora sp. PR83]